LLILVALECFDSYKIDYRDGIANTILRGGTTRKAHQIWSSSSKFLQAASKIVSCQEDMLLRHMSTENSATTRRQDEVQYGRTSWLHSVLR